MTYKVKINNKDVIEVETGNTILEAALENGIDFPHGCRSGNCGACKAKRISGEIEMSPYSEFALEDEEKENNYILACRSVPWSDCEINIFSEDKKNIINHKIKEFETRVKSFKKITQDIYVINLEYINLKNNFEFYAGQYAELTFNNLAKKHFSMANSPETKDLEFHVKVLNNGETSEYIKNKLKINEKVKVKGPYGNAFLRTTHRGPIIALAGGTGLAPILSIIKSSIKNKLKQPIKIYYGAQTEKDLYFKDILKEIALKNKNIEFNSVVNVGKNNSDTRIGKVTDAVIEDIEDFDGYKAYLAGPPKMIEAAEKLFLSLGIRKIDMHSDAFYTSYEEAGSK